MVVRVPLGDPAVDVSVVAWNSWPHLRTNLPAIAAQDYPAYRIVVVDNASSDATADEVEARFPDVTVIRSEHNGGYAAGNNLCFARSRSRYIAVLNPDARPEAGWLTALVRALDEHPNAALATSKVLLASGPERVNACGLDVHLSGMAFCRGLGDSAASYEHVQRVAAVSGASFVVRRDVLEEIGGLDERFFMYMEDTELSMRARLAGYDVVLAPESRVVHEYALDISPWKFYYLERNRFLMMMNIFRWRTLLLMAPVLLLTEAGVWAHALRSGRAMLLAKARSYVSLAAALPAALARRRRVQRKRRAGDAALLAQMTPDLPAIGRGTGALTAVANRIVRGYSLILKRLVRW
jgi:GT2 family glycosyltransferase